MSGSQDAAVDQNAAVDELSTSSVMVPPMDSERRGNSLILSIDHPNDVSITNDKERRRNTLYGLILIAFGGLCMAGPVSILGQETVLAICLNEGIPEWICHAYIEELKENMFPMLIQIGGEAHTAFEWHTILKNQDGFYQNVLFGCTTGIQFMENAYSITKNASAILIGELNLGAWYQVGGVLVSGFVLYHLVLGSIRLKNQILGSDSSSSSSSKYVVSNIWKHFPSVTAVVDTIAGFVCKGVLEGNILFPAGIPLDDELLLTSKRLISDSRELNETDDTYADVDGIQGILRIIYPEVLESEVLESKVLESKVLDSVKRSLEKDSPLTAELIKTDISIGQLLSIGNEEELQTKFDIFMKSKERLESGKGNLRHLPHKEWPRSRSSSRDRRPRSSSRDRRPRYSSSDRRPRSSSRSRSRSRDRRSSEHNGGSSFHKRTIKISRRYRKKRVNTQKRKHVK